VNVIRKGNPNAWWHGMVGSCQLCGGQWLLTKDDSVEHFDWLLDNIGLRYASPTMACPNKDEGCKGEIHFHPLPE
jgi:hypothetical protein